MRVHLSPYLMLAVMLLVTSMAATLIGAVLAAWSLLHPPRMNDGKAIWLLKRLSPGDLGLKFTEEFYEVLDEARPSGHRVTLAAWWIEAPHATDQCVVLIHGYADAKVGAIAWAPLFHELGFNILAIDLRAHGDSGGTFITAGVTERHDVRQAMDQLRARRPAQAARFVIFGASLGANVAVAVASLGDSPSSDVCALVLDSPYNDFARVAARHIQRLGGGGRFFQQLTLRIATAWARVNVAEVNLSLGLPQVPAPVLVIESGDDLVVDAIERQAVNHAIQARRNPADVLWQRPGVPHLLAMQQDPEAYREQVRAFLTGAGLEMTSQTEMAGDGHMKISQGFTATPKL